MVKKRNLNNVNNIMLEIDEFNSKIHRKKRITLKGKSLDKVFPKEAGVYVIYKHNKPIYVGQSNNIHNRFKHNHLSDKNGPSRSSFRNTLHKKYNLKWKNTTK